MEKSPSSACTIRFNDCDLFGHLNNSRYLDYFLNAREDHLKAFYDINLSELYRQGLAWVVSSHEIIYLRPAVYNEQVRIQTALLFADEGSLFLECLMLNEQGTKLKAIMRSRLVAVDPQTQRKARHPPDFMLWAKSAEHLSFAAFSYLQDRVKAFS